MLILHLGSGASICALEDGRSMDSSMAFSALDGVPMGTRPGQLDPGVILHLVRAGWTAERLERLLYRESGLKALSGLSSDMRELVRHRVFRASHRQGDGRARRGAGRGGWDRLHRQHRRELGLRTRAGLPWRGLARRQAGKAANASGRSIISEADSSIPVYVVPTDEELMIARQTFALTGSGP